MPRDRDDPDPIFAAAVWLTIIILIVLAARSRSQDYATCPDDVRWFGIDHHTSQAEWLASLRERDRLFAERWLWESMDCRAEWEQEYADQYYRWQCWDAFDDALRLWPGCERRLSAARKLRALLGDEDYYRGIMPQAVRVR